MISAQAPSSLMDNFLGLHVRAEAEARVEDAMNVAAPLVSYIPAIQKARGFCTNPPSRDFHSLRSHTSFQQKHSRRVLGSDGEGCGLERGGVAWLIGMALGESPEGQEDRSGGPHAVPGHPYPPNGK